MLIAKNTLVAFSSKENSGFMQLTKAHESAFLLPIAKRKIPLAKGFLGDNIV